MPTTSAGNAIAHIQPDPDHDIVLDKGVLSDAGAHDLRQAFGLVETQGATHLCVFFHGGLVSQEAGLKTAHQLVQTFEGGGAYPFFFIWKSGLLDAIKGLLRPPIEHPAFVAAANRAVKMVALKMTAALDTERSLKRLRLSARSLRETPMTLRQLAGVGKQFDRKWAKHGGAQLGVTAGELDQFVELVLDIEKGIAVRDRLFKSSQRAALRLGLAKVFQRLNSGHDHGLYTTVIEELLIAIGVGIVAAAIWKEMKNFIDWSFKDEPTAGGTEFLDLLCAYWRKRPQLRLTLIGHSAGAIYVQKFIEELDRRLQPATEPRVEVAYLAGAVSFARVYQGLGVFESRVSGLRAFGLKDSVEGGYWEFPGYDKSLLYFVSGVCDPDPNDDKALVGMRRYWSDAKPYKTPDIRAIADFIGEARKVLSPTDKKRPPPWGYRCGATRHGGFSLDAQMKVSMKVMLEGGVGVNHGGSFPH
jgi:hypothetical protein